MKIATWNLQRVRPGSGARSLRVRQAIKEIDADIWVLTETHPDFDLAAEYQRVAVSEPAADRDKGDCWVAIWARKGISATGLEPKGEPERTAAIRLDGAMPRALVVFGTVLPWRGDTRHATLRGGRAFEAALAAQTKDLDEFARAGAELCVAGDFNQELGANGPVGTALGRAVFDELLSSRQLRCVTGGARDPLRSRGWPANIDHVLLSSGLRDCETMPTIWPEQHPLPRNLSDHHGMCACIEFGS